ncbi:toll-like receptor 4 [Haliotis asinina]|uniref:toll-like receptor 4 n=1 Tax=Haliotis asinina TaxID=109174 RepID=UPI00353209C2
MSREIRSCAFYKYSAGLNGDIPFSNVKEETAADKLKMSIPNIFLVLLSAVSAQMIRGRPDAMTVCDVTSVNVSFLADCSSRNLSEVPVNFPTNTFFINLRQNHLQTILNNSFQDLSSVRVLNLSDNRISQLKVNAFEGLPNLEELYLQLNFLKLEYSSYPPGVFDPLKKLKVLRMEYNDLSKNGSYPDQIFKPLITLKELSIDTMTNPVFNGDFTSLRDLESLQFSGTLNGPTCLLEIIRNNTFSVFQSLKTLNLRWCSLRYVHKDAFKSSKFLEILDISHNYDFGVVNAIESLQSLTDINMTFIDASNVLKSYTNHWEVRLNDSIVTKQKLQALEKVCVKELKLSNNDILLIDIGDLALSTFSTCINKIDVSGNRIAEIPNLKMIRKFRNLVNLDVSNQKMQGVTGISHGLSLRTGPPKNELPFPSLYITIPNTLKSLNSSHFPWRLVTVFYHVHFTNARHLKELNISRIGLKFFPSTTVSGLSALRVLDVSDNTLMHFRFMGTVFKPLQKLEKVYMDAVMMSGDNEDPEQFDWISTVFRHLREFSFSRNRVVSVNPTIFQNAVNLTKLRLSQNEFKQFPFDIRTTPRLQELDLQYNAITQLSSKTCDQVDLHQSNVQGFVLKLNGNIISCGCRTLGFVQWLSETFVTLDRGGNYTCIGENGAISSTKAINLEQLWRACEGRFWLYLTLSTYLVFVIGILVFILVKRNKTRLVYWFFRLSGLNVLLPTRGDFVYDVNVMHADVDYRWACYTLRQRLEIEKGFRLLLHDRDILPGVNKADAIMQSVHGSWKTILYLTPAFLQEDWAYFSLCTATLSISDVMTGRLLLLVPVRDDGDCEYPYIPQVLLNSVRECNIVWMHDSEEEEEAFWNKIETLLLEN